MSKSNSSRFYIRSLTGTTTRFAHSKQLSRVTAAMPAYFLLVGIGLFPFYLFPSGGIQIAHALLAFGALFYFVRFPASPLSETESLAGSLFCVFAITSGMLWYLVHQDDGALLGPVFMIYNICIYAALIAAFRRYSEFFRAWLPWAMAFGMLTQVFWYLNGWGTERMSRFHGTFNDPNQLIYWTICAMGVVAVLERDRLRWSLIFFVLTLIILMYTVSRSGLLGFLPLILLILYKSLGFLWNENTFSGLRVKLSVAFIVLMAFASIFTGIVSVSNIQFWAVEQISILNQRMAAIDYDESLEVRGYELLWLYPEHLFLGAGHGGLERFALARGGTGTTYEIHSTFAGFLFYYGFLGSIIIAIFLYPKLRRLTLSAALALFAAGLFGIGTYGARNTMVWVLLAVVATYGQRDFEVPLLRKKRGGS